MNDTRCKQRNKLPNKDAEDIFANIDGPMLREQRRVVLQLQDSELLTIEQKVALDGLTNLLDQIADCCNDIYGKDTLFSELQLDCLAEEDQYVRRIEVYNH